MNSVNIVYVISEFLNCEFLNERGHESPIELDSKVMILRTATLT